MTVLVVEDKLTSLIKIQEVIHKFTAEHNIFVKTTSESMAAYEIANKLWIDIFIIDIDLPDYDGLQLSRGLRDIPKYRHTPIIVESHKVNNDFICKVHEEIDNIAYIKKPFDIKMFERKFNRAIEIVTASNFKKFMLEESGVKHIYSETDIIYIEKINYSKQINIVYHNNVSGLSSDSFFLSLEKLKKIIGNSSRLVQIHRSYIINPDFIYSIDAFSRLITLREADKSIPIGSTYYKVAQCL